jgi:hypothetical protein
MGWGGGTCEDTREDQGGRRGGKERCPKYDLKFLLL